MIIVTSNLHNYTYSKGKENFKNVSSNVRTLPYCGKFYDNAKGIVACA